jgi:hypothetical protein
MRALNYCQVSFKHFVGYDHLFNSSHIAAILP